MLLRLLVFDAPAMLDPPPILGLDIGDCLSNTKLQCADSEQWRTAETGAYAFMVLFTLTHGPDSVHIFRNKCIHFVQQLGFREMGVPDSPIHRISARTGIGGKGPEAKRLGLTHMVDNDQECLWSVMCDPCGNAQKTLHKVILFTGPQEMSQNVWPGEFNDKLMKCKSWLEIAKFFELHYCFEFDSEFDLMWQHLSAHGPPHMQPLGPTDLMTLWRQIREGQIRARLLQQVPPAASAEAAPAIDTEEQEQHRYLRRKALEQYQHRRASSSESESESESSSGSSSATPPSGNDDAPNKEADARSQSAAAADQGTWWCPTGGSAASAGWAASASWASDYHNYGKADPAASAGASWTEMYGWEQNNGRWKSEQNNSHEWKSTMEQHRSVDAKWTQKKLLRAQRHRDGSLPVRGANSLVPLCRQCKRNQPSPYCIVQGELCSVCCEQHRCATGIRCPQHQHL